MKKLILITLMIASAFGLYAQNNNFSTEVSTGFESEYTFRGIEQADSVIVSAVELDYKSLYLGAVGYVDVDSDVKFDSEVDLYAGVTLGEVLGASVDVGVIAYTYPNAETSLGETDYSVEGYLGLIFDEVLLNPSTYVFYDIQRESLTLEAKVSETFVSENVIPLLGNLTLTPTATLGYTDINDVTPRGVNTDDAYKYASVSVDVSAHAFGGQLSVGPRYSWTDGADVDFNELSWGCSVSYTF